MGLLTRVHNIMDNMGVELLTPKEFKNMGYGNKKHNDNRI
jgi:hypothetical protein